MSSDGRRPGRAERTSRWMGRRSIWGVTVIYSAFVAYMSLRPFGDTPVEQVIDRVGRAYFHLPAYAGLAALLALGLDSCRTRRWRAAVGFAAATAYGWLLELAQIPAPTRSFNVQGLLFDATGAAIGAAAALAWLFWRDRSHRRV